MKEIKAIIQPFMADEVISALRGMEGLPGLTVSEVKGFGRSQITGDQGEPDAIFGVKKIKLEIVVPDHLAETVTRVSS
ncbi:MAG: P-II family nitrogen regulator [Acidobacteria bacterium]|nr:P-II family nitrogen regulator [Acidobacteriota bacterium]